MSLEIALSGINAVNGDLDTISNNIANAGTDGYKSSRMNFSAVYSGTRMSGAATGSTSQTLQTVGSTVATGSTLDAALTGRGFFEVKTETGATQYTRVGNFSVDKDGLLRDNLGRKVQGYAATPGSTALGAVGDLKVPTGQLPAALSSKLTFVANLSTDWTVPVNVFDPTDATSFNSSQVSILYDSLGAQHSLTQYFSKAGTNAVTAHYALDGTDTGLTTAMTFGADGQLTAPTAPVTLALGTPVNGAAAMSIDVNYAGTTQFAGDYSVSANSADGYASGTLAGESISSSGQLLATYSNGQKLTMGTLAIATFPDEAALTNVSGTSWEASNASGSVLRFAPGTGMASSLVIGSLEKSNVDITSELVNLMSAQRNYQANAKVISTENQTIQALLQAV